MKTEIQVYERIKQKVVTFSKFLRFDKFKKKVGRKLALPLEDSISLALFWKKQGVKTKKSVYEILEIERYCTYKTFVVSINRFLRLALVVLALILWLNRKDTHPVKHTDATDLPVCLMKNVDHHKTMKGLATLSKNTKGWYYGLKLHLTSDLNRKVLAVKITSANASDRKTFLDLNQGLTGIFVADSGYVSARLEKEFYLENKRILLTKPLKTMKKLMTYFQFLLYNTRMTIELNFRNLKLFCGLVTSLPRSVDGYLANYIYSLLAYLIA